MYAQYKTLQEEANKKAKEIESMLTKEITSTEKDILKGTHIVKGVFMFLLSLTKSCKKVPCKTSDIILLYLQVGTNKLIKSLENAKVNEELANAIKEYIHD